MFLVVFGVTLLSRLPFLDAGYGAPDAWRVVRAARAIAGGAYEASRLPGFPVHEITSSFFVGLGPVGLNALTALLSAVAAGFLALIVRASGRSGALWAGVTLALVPVFYTQSVQTLDTPWAVAFMTAALYCALTRRPLAAGVALGLAIGCRVTSGAAALPALILLSGAATPRVFVRRALVFGVTALALGVVCYLPVYSVYGSDFFGVSGWGKYSPDAGRIVAMALDGVWGKLGKWVFIVAALSAAVVLWRRRVRIIEALRTGTVDRATIAWISGLALFVTAFLVYPHPRYFVPALPFLILLFACVFSARGVRFLAVGALVASFVSTCSATVFCWGPVPAAHVDRQRDVAYVQRIVERGAALGKGSVIAVASWLPKIQICGAGVEGSARFVYTVDSALADTIQRENLRLWYIQYAPEYNRAVTGVNLDSIGGAPLALD